MIKTYTEYDYFFKKTHLKPFLRFVNHPQSAHCNF